jgi:hypothetical protein
VTEREKLKREIKLLAQTIETNVVTLASKTMTLDDREALKRQMAIRCVPKAAAAAVRSPYTHAR